MSDYNSTSITSDNNVFWIHYKYKRLVNIDCLNPNIGKSTIYKHILTQRYITRDAMSGKNSQRRIKTIVSFVAFLKLSLPAQNQKLK